VRIEVVDDPKGMSPYGWTGRELGLSAVRAANALADEPPWDGNPERRWLESDHVVFNRVVEFTEFAERSQGDLCTAGIGQPPPYAKNALNYVHNLRRLHVALPFSEAERFWVADTMFHGASGSRRLGYPYGANAVRKRVADLYDAGRSRRAIGTELMDTFWAWRREIFEFEGAGSLDIAVEALQSIGQILLPNVPEVASYRPPHIPELRARREARGARRQAEKARA
jgi:hypothetical protein